VIAETLQNINGAGIAPALEPGLFRPFNQLTRYIQAVLAHRLYNGLLPCSAGTAATNEFQKEALVSISRFLQRSGSSDC
jgi:hypothetical protein